MGKQDGTPREREGYFGVFVKLADLNVYDAASDELYGKDSAQFYNRVLGDYAGDIPLFLRLLPDPAATVLDLACGAGRIGLALAREGFHVDGLELSPHMLALVDGNLEHETAAVKSRLRFIAGDMTDFALPDRYDLITLGVTSISLLLASEQRDALFRCVQSHLKPGGKFIFDFLNLSGDRWKVLDGFLDVWSDESDEGVDFGIVGQMFYPERQTFIFNLYRELVGWDGSTRRSIATSTKAWLHEEDLVAAMDRAGLEIVDRFDLEKSTYLVSQRRES